MGYRIMAIIGIAVMLIFVSAPFLTTNAIDLDTIVISELIDIIIETLEGWGVEFSSEVAENIKILIESGITEYLADEVHESLNDWITGMNWIYDNFGRRIMNATGLNHVYAFATWFQTKYGYSDNDSVNVGGTYNVGGLVCYKLPVTLEQNDSHPRWTTYISDGTDDVYIAFYGSVGSGTGAFSTGYYAFSKSVCTVTVQNIKPNGSVSDSTPTVIDTVVGSWYGERALPGGSNIGIAQNPWLTIYNSQSEIIDYLDDNTNVTTSPPVIITTGDITYPVDDPSYESGMSIIYFPDGTVGYIQIDWPDSVSVDNLPAIVSTSSVPDPGFNQVFQPLRAFVTTFTDGMAIIKDIVFHLPTEAVAIFYAITSITVIFGALHMFKEH